MDLEKELDRFYYHQTVNELRLINESGLYPGVSYTSFLYLNLIAYRKECTVSYLSKVLHVSMPAVTAKVNELQRQGYVQKTRSEKDKRVYYLQLSSTLSRDFRVYDEPYTRAVQKVKQRYSKAEIDTFCAMLKTFSDTYQKEDKA
ncbi:MarR family transcriptional regulator [Ruminococcaceae bacterium OttesenSCG-928-I18]|nr:MarR family transcriptional regulator [Ruminococcaceae bacterium OttesenSCG-928-I18]